jgi:hypothetical protein
MEQSMQKKFYFPAKLDDAVAVVRGTMRLSELFANRGRIVGYNDRAVAALHGREFLNEEKPNEVPLIVVEIDDDVIHELVYGDFTHFGPCVHWRNLHALEFENFYAEDRFTHDGRFSLEVISD